MWYICVYFWGGGVRIFLGGWLTSHETILVEEIRICIQCLCGNPLSHWLRMLDILRHICDYVVSGSNILLNTELKIIARYPYLPLGKDVIS